MPPPPAFGKKRILHSNDLFFISRLCTLHIFQRLRNFRAKTISARREDKQSLLITLNLFSFRFLEVSDGTAQRSNDESWRDTTDFKNTPGLVDPDNREVNLKNDS